MYCICSFVFFCASIPDSRFNFNISLMLAVFVQNKQQERFTYIIHIKNDLLFIFFICFVFIKMKIPGLVVFIGVLFSTVLLCRCCPSNCGCTIDSIVCQFVHKDTVYSHNVLITKAKFTRRISQPRICIIRRI